MTVADLIIRLAVDGKGVAKGVNTAMAEFHRIGRAAGNLFAGYFSASTISNQAAKLIQYAGKITDLKGVTDASTDALQAFDFAAQKSSASIEHVAEAIKKLATAQVEALNGNTQKLDMFSRYKVSAEELKALRPEEIFQRIAAEVQNMPHSARLLDDLEKLMGGTGPQLLPAMQKGFADAAAEARELGIIIDEQVLNQIDAMGDEFGTLGRTIMAGMAPALGWISQRFTDFRAAISYIGAALGSLSVDFPKDAKGTLLDLILPTKGNNAFGRASKAGEDAAVSVYQHKDALLSRDTAGSGFDTGEGAAQKKAAEELADIREKNAKALSDALFKQLSREEKINLLFKERARLAQLIASEKDPLKREQMIARDIDAFSDLQGLRNQKSKQSLGTPPAVDQLARIGLYRGGMEGVQSAVERQIGELRSINSKLAQLNSEIAKDY